MLIYSLIENDKQQASYTFSPLEFQFPHLYIIHLILSLYEIMDFVEVWKCSVWLISICSF